MTTKTGKTNEVEKEETIVQPKNTDVQNALDILLRGAMFSHLLGQEMRKNALAIHNCMIVTRLCQENKKKNCRFLQNKLNIVVFALSYSKLYDRHGKSKI